MHNIELQANLSAQTQLVIATGQRIESLESSTSHCLPLINEMMQNRKHRLDGIDAGTPRFTRGTHRRENQKGQTTKRHVHEDFK